MVGVSHDSVESHVRFREEYDVPFRLVSDSDRRVIDAYGVRRLLGLSPTKRVTYLIDKERVIRGVYHHEIAIGRHHSDVLKGLQRLVEAESADKSSARKERKA